MDGTGGFLLKIGTAGFEEVALTGREEGTNGFETDEVWEVFVFDEGSKGRFTLEGPLAWFNEGAASRGRLDPVSGGAAT